MTTNVKQMIEDANLVALGHMTSSEPVLVDIAPAGDVVPGLTDRLILHSGPPVAWSDISGAQKGACIAMAIFEGWAIDAAEAESLLASGSIQREPNHAHDAVGPMAGTITRSLPVYVVENQTNGNRAFARVVEDRQQFGDFSTEAIDELKLWRDTWAPSMGAGVRHLGGVPLKQLIARALHMGDELHNRPDAATSLFASVMSVAMVEANVEREALISTLKYLGRHQLLFLGLSMASAKAAADAARDVPYSTMVVAMARNGTEFGIRVSGLGDEWFTAPAPEIDGLMLPGYRQSDAGLDMGDSAITETVGWGGFVLAGAPGILELVGGTPADALGYTQEMGQITIGTSPDFKIPAIGFQGAPVGIDIRKVVQTGILPIIDTAMAHKEPGHAIIGAGMVRPPMECFQNALRAFAKKYAG